MDKDLVSTSLCYVDIYALQQQILPFYVPLLDSEHVSIKEGVCALTVGFLSLMVGYSICYSGDSFGCLCGGRLASASVDLLQDIYLLLLLP